MAGILPDEKLVYTLLKDIFQGQQAEIRRLKTVARLIRKRHEQGDLQGLIPQYEVAAVSKVASKLLRQRVFELSVKAEARFPELFDSFAVRGIKHAASEAKIVKVKAPNKQEMKSDAAKAKTAKVETAETTTSLISVFEQGSQAATCENHEVEECGVVNGKDAKDFYEDVVAKPWTRSTTSAAIPIPSPDSAYYPYNFQHRLLTELQALLEGACYVFAQKRLRDVLHREGWDCPEAVELHKWSRVLVSNSNKFSHLARDINGQVRPLQQLGESLTQLRHTAIHRQRVSVKQLEHFIMDAETLVVFLQDDVAIKKLSRLQQETELIVGKVKRNREKLKLTLAARLKEIASQRAELARLEHTAVADVLKQDEECQASMGSNLQKAMMSAERVA